MYVPGAAYEIVGFNKVDVVVLPPVNVHLNLYPAVSQELFTVGVNVTGTFTHTFVELAA